MSTNNWIEEFDEPMAEKTRIGKNPNRFKGKNNPLGGKIYLLGGGFGLLLVILLLFLFRGCGAMPAGQLEKLESRLSLIEDKLIGLEAEQTRQKELIKRFDRQEDFQVLVHRLDSLEKNVTALQEKISGMDQAKNQKQPEEERQETADTDFLRQRTYTVRPGDTLYSIGVEHEVTVEELRRWNDLGQKGIIYPGQELVVAPDSDE